MLLNGSTSWKISPHQKFSPTHILKIHSSRQCLNQWWGNTQQSDMSHINITDIYFNVLWQAHITASWISLHPTPELLCTKHLRCYTCLQGSWKCYSANPHIWERDCGNPVKSDVTAMENSCTVHPAQASHHVCDGARISRLQQFIVLTPCALFLRTIQKVSA